MRETVDFAVGGASSRTVECALGVLAQDLTDSGKVGVVVSETAGADVEDGHDGGFAFRRGVCDEEEEDVGLSRVGSCTCNQNGIFSFLCFGAMWNGPRRRYIPPPLGHAARLVPNPVTRTSLPKMFSPLFATGSVLA